jgi:hypothetical protein
MNQGDIEFRFVGADSVIVTRILYDFHYFLREPEAVHAFNYSFPACISPSLPLPWQE